MTAVAVLPEVGIDVDGSRFSDATVACLEEARISRRLSAPAQCLLSFHLDTPAPALGALRPGAVLSFRAGPGPAPLFSGEVTGVESVYGADGSRRLRVRAYDLLHRLRQRHTQRAFVDVTVSELARELLGRGIDVVGPDGPRRNLVASAGATDLDLLARHAHRVGSYVVVDDGAVRLTSLEGYGDVVTLRIGHDVHEVVVDVDRHRAVSTVEAVSWRPDDAAVLHASAQPPGGSGPVAWEAPQVLLDLASSADDELDAIATAESARRGRAGLVLRAVADGHPGLVPGRRVAVEGVAELAGSALTITSSVLTIDRDGHLVRLTTEPPEPLPAPSPPVLTLGEVTDVDDPDRRARVQVRLPTAGDIVTPWAPVVTAGAGSGRGLVALPDVGDVVVIALLHGDPGRPIVLGSLYGAASPTDDGVDDGRTKRFNVALPSGAALTLDDARGTVRLAHPNRSSVELSGDAVRITSTVPLFIDASGQPVTIRARAVDFQEAP